MMIVNIVTYYLLVSFASVSFRQAMIPNTPSFPTLIICNKLLSVIPIALMHSLSISILTQADIIL